MKNWFKSLSKTVRNTICIAPLAIGGIFIILYALYEMLLLLIVGIVLVVLCIVFLWLNGKINQEEKFKMTPEEEAEHNRKMEESEKRGEADAALIDESELSNAIDELQKQCDKKENYYNGTTNKASRIAAAYDLMYTNAKLRAAIKRKMKILRPDAQFSNEAAVNITIGIERDIELPLYTKAVGVTFDNRQEYIRESKIGDPLFIKHIPSEQFPNSCDIINIRTNQSLGRIKSELADRLIDTFGQQFILNGKIAEITGGTSDRENFGCNIQILSVSEDSDK